VGQLQHFLHVFHELDQHELSVVVAETAEEGELHFGLLFVPHQQQELVKQILDNHLVVFVYF